MPTHIHLLMQQLEDNGISKFMNLLLKSYSKYFNEKYNRKGPLWEGRFKNVLVETNEQFLHLTRYIHLNPVTADLVNAPEEWKYSSYLEYLALIDKNKMICNFNSYLDMEATSYKKFVKDGISYEKVLAKIKNSILLKNIFLPDYFQKTSFYNL